MCTASAVPVELVPRERPLPFSVAVTERRLPNLSKYCKRQNKRISPQSFLPCTVPEAEVVEEGEVEDMEEEVTVVVVAAVDVVEEI